MTVLHICSVFEVPKDSEVKKKSNRNEANDGKFTEDELLANVGTDGRRKRKRRKEIRETEETERLSELQMSDKDKQHMNDLNDSRLIETSVNEDLSKESKKLKRKFNADLSDSITLPRSHHESNEYDHLNGNHAIASGCSQVAADSCLVDENIDCHDGSLGHHAVKMKCGSVKISNVAICEVSNIGSTDETRVEEVETEVAVNVAHECVSGIRPCLTETQKSKKRTRRSKKHRKTNLSSAAVSNDAFLNSANKRVNFVLTNVSDDVSDKSRVIMSTGRTVASANSVGGAFANSQHIIFDDEDDGNGTNAGSDSINAQIISSSVIKNYSGRLTEAVGKEHLTQIDSNGISGHNGKSRGLPMTFGEAESIETEIFHAAEFLAPQHLSGPVANESNQQQIKPPLNRGVLPGVSTLMFSKPGVNNFGSASQLLDNNASRHKPGRPATNNASPFANVQVFSRQRQKKHPATTESASAAVESFPLSSMIHSSPLPKEVCSVENVSGFNETLE